MCGQSLFGWITNGEFTAGGMKRLFCSKSTRNRVYRELQRNGVTARRGAIEEVLIPPLQVEDFEQEEATTFWFNSSERERQRPMFFHVLYTLEVDD